MGAGASAVQYQGQKPRSRSAAVGGAITFTLVVGLVATLAAAAASTLVDSVVFKRVLWVSAAMIVAISAGLWRAGAAPTASPPDSDRLSYGSQAGSPH
jgi:hypothetical protein